MKILWTYMAITISSLFLLLLYVDSAKPKAKSGPYYSRAIRTNKCEVPSLPYHENPRGIPSAEMYNTSKRQNLIRVNITILKVHRDVVVKTRNYYWYNENWKLVYQFSNPGCHSRLIKTVAALYGYHRVNCTISKGFFSFDNIDMNQLEHLWSQTKEYGRSLWKFETIYERKADACWETESIIVPAPA